LPMEADTIDLAFAWSIFSHYSERAQQRWLTELHRILRPGGYLLMSVQSDHLLTRMINENMSVETRSEAVNLKELVDAYHSSGFGFYRCYDDAADEFGFDRENFGMAFISPAYIRSNWTKLFDVVCIDPGVVGNFQDVVLLRKL
jgi:Methyltransferase domain